MKDVKFNPNEKGVFYLEENGERIAEMIVGVSGNEMSVYHTEVIDKYKGKGLGTKLIDAMTDHARLNNFLVIPHCPFVKAHFRKFPEAYSDIWKTGSL